MKKLLCLLGIHQWRYWKPGLAVSVHWYPGAGDMPGWIWKVCDYCGKKKNNLN